MLPTTHKMTSKTAQTAVKQAVATHNHLQKEHLLKTVNDVVLEYTTSTGKKKSTAQQEIFTIEHLSWKKHTLYAKDIFMQEWMEYYNKGMYSHPVHIMLRCTWADIYQASSKGIVSTLQLLWRNVICPLYFSILFLLFFPFFRHSLGTFLCSWWQVAIPLLLALSLTWSLTLASFVTTWAWHRLYLEPDTGLLCDIMWEQPVTYHGHGTVALCASLFIWLFIPSVETLLWMYSVLLMGYYPFSPHPLSRSIHTHSLICIHSLPFGIGGPFFILLLILSLCAFYTSPFILMLLVRV